MRSSFQLTYGTTPPPSLVHPFVLLLSLLPSLAGLAYVLFFHHWMFAFLSNGFEGFGMDWKVCALLRGEGGRVRGCDYCLGVG